MGGQDNMTVTDLFDDDTGHKCNIASGDLGKECSEQQYTVVKSECKEMEVVIWMVYFIFDSYNYQAY